MNVEKLHALVAELKQDEESKVVQLLENLNAHLQNQVNTPQKPTYQQSVAGTFAKIKEKQNDLAGFLCQRRRGFLVKMQNIR